MWPFQKKRFPKKKAILLSAGAALFILFALALLSAKFLAGGEDAWLCVNGSWVKHGNPSNPPIGQCGERPVEGKKTKPVDGNSMPVTKYEIKMTDSGLEPAELTIAVNNTVTWINVGSENNSVVPLTDTASLGLSPLWSRQSPPIGAGGGTFTVGFPRTGVFRYRCANDPTVIGEITIEQ